MRSRQSARPGIIKHRAMRNKYLIFTLALIFYIGLNYTFKKNLFNLSYLNDELTILKFRIKQYWIYSRDNLKCLIFL